MPDSGTSAPRSALFEQCAAICNEGAELAMLREDRARLEWMMAQGFGFTQIGVGRLTLRTREDIDAHRRRDNNG